MDNIRTIMLQVPPWIHIEKTDGLAILKAGGVATKFMELYLASLNMTHTKAIPFDFAFGIQQDNKSWTGITGMIQRDEADLCPSTVLTYQRMDAVDIVTSLYVTNVGIFGSAPPTAEMNISGIILVFQLPVWIALFLAVVVLTTINSLEVVQSDEVVKVSFVSRKMIGDVLFDYISIFLFEASYRNTYQIRHRILQGVWWLTVLVLMNAFCGNFRAKMMQKEMPQLVGSAHDLANRDDLTPLMWGSSIFPEIFKDHGGNADYKKIYNRMVSRNGMLDGKLLWSEDSYQSIIERKAMMINEQSTTKHFLGLNCRKTSPDESRLYTAEEVIFPHCIGVVINKKFGRHLAERIRDKIGRVTESGVFDHWMDVELRDWLICSSPQMPIPEATPMTLKDLIGIFYMVLIAQSFACLVCLLEMVYSVVIRNLGSI